VPTNGVMELEKAADVLNALPAGERPPAMP
jgi:hypothetical protein